MRALRTIGVSTILLLASWAEVEAVSFPAGYTGTGSWTSFNGSFFGGAHGAFTGPDFSVNINIFAGGDTRTRFPRCVLGNCSPGDIASAFATEGSPDIAGTMTWQGQAIPLCNVSGRPPFATSGLCGFVDMGLGWSAVLPEFSGHTETTAEGNFAASVFVRISETEGGSSRLIGGAFFFGGGPSFVDLEWQEVTGTWRILSLEGVVSLEPVPEPATLLLFGTTAAGLGLARWYQRRGRQHAA